MRKLERKISTLQRAGGLAAWGEALSYIVGFTLFILFLDFPSSSESPVQSLIYLIENKTLILSTMSIIYVVGALLLLILVLALHERLNTTSPLLMQVTTAIGIIWVGVVVASGMIFTVGVESAIRIYAHDPERAATVWLAVGVVQDGLGGGTELLGGLWIFAISWAAISNSRLPKPLNWFGLLIGLAGILSIVPAWSVLVDIFGLSQIIWFIWLGTIMLGFGKNR